MIIFHEGLPRSGKSYEAMKVRIIPAIKAGRCVVAYVEGINHAQIAELCGITEERCKELLIALNRSDLQTVHTDEKTAKVLKVQDHLPQLARDNALIVLDEAQNFWGTRARLGPGMTEFITEHGHRGIDLVLMGQDLRDVHATWRRRVELKLCFLKLNGLALKGWAAKVAGNIAKPRYSVTTYRHLGGDSYSKTGLSITLYEPKYFGTYKSFVSDDTNTEVYTDKRAQAWNHPVLKYIVPIALAGACWGLWNSWKFFHPDEPKQAQTRTNEPQKVTQQPRTAPAPLPAQQAQATQPDQRSPIERRMTELSSKGRIRLAGMISSKNHTNGIVEWVQGGTVVLDRLSLDALRSLGVAVLVTENVIQLEVGEYKEIATPWPLDDPGRVSESRQAYLRGPAPNSASTNLPSGIAEGAQPPSFIDRPGSITKRESIGSSLNRATQPGG